MIFKGVFLISIRNSLWLFFMYTMTVCGLDKIEITIDPPHMDYMDKNPYYDTSFIGTFSCDSTVYAPTRLNYRGAYSLYFQIRFKNLQRNWKVKTPKVQKYRKYRVWNYNHEPYLNHNLAYKLFHNAGVPCIGMRHVDFYVNGTKHGLYSEFPDPDNKKWLKNTFGDTADYAVGDLFKACTDKPNMNKKYFANLTILGDKDSDYYLHYNKKTNDSTSESEKDYSSIRNFIKIINETPDAQFADTINKYFDVASFLKYLIVANYSSFWDGYPNRSKNFWLYKCTRSGKWVFIPWDLNETFNPKKRLFNNMGTECNYLFMYNESNLNTYYTSVYRTNDNGKSEITPKPLFTRIMNVEKYRSLYASMYKQALSTYLKKETVLGLIDSLAAVVNQSGLSLSDSLDVDTSIHDMKLFVQNRTQSLEKQLRSITARTSFNNKIHVGHFYFLASHGSFVQMINNAPFPVLCNLYQVNGRSIGRLDISAKSRQSFDASSFGILIYDILGKGGHPLARGFVVVK